MNSSLSSSLRQRVLLRTAVKVGRSLTVYYDVASKGNSRSVSQSSIKPAVIVNAGVTESTTAATRHRTSRKLSFLPPCLHTRLQTRVASVPQWAASNSTRRTARKRRRTSLRTSTRMCWWNSSRKQETWRRWREPGASSRCTRILRASPKRLWLFSRTRRTNLCLLLDWRASRWSFDEWSFRREALQMCAQIKRPWSLGTCWRLVFFKTSCWTWWCPVRVVLVCCEIENWSSDWNDPRATKAELEDTWVLMLLVLTHHAGHLKYRLMPRAKFD